MTATAPAPSSVAPVTPPVSYWKPGYKTTELAVVVLTDIGLIVSSSANWLPPRYAAIGSTVAAAAYAASRGLSKMNPPKPTA